MNNCTFIGRMTKDPVKKIVPINGVETSVLNFYIAVDDGFGDYKKTDFIHVTAWRGAADAIAQYMTKGREIAIKGAVHLETYEKDGETRLDGLPYQERLKAIDAMREHGDGSGDSLADSLARNDDYIGDGRHWVWDMDDLMSVQGALTRDAFLVSPWKRATATFFEDVAAAAAAGLGNAGASYLNNFFQGLDLETKFPYPMDGKDQDRLLYENLLRSNRIL